MKHPFPPRLPDNAHTKKLLGPIREAARAYLESPIAALPYSSYVSFWNSGNRTAYEAHYMEHRRRLNVFTAMALSSDEDKWLKGLEDILWAICDEFTWALPAHVRGREEAEFDEHVHTVDLFAAETAFALSEVYALLGERLAPLVRHRIAQEVQRRVVGSYMERQLSWPKNNWSAVCAGAIGSAMLLLGLEDIFERAKERLLTAMRLFLDSYHDDGCCLEGTLYWGYGFGYFCFFADLLRQYSKGKIDLFRDEKVHRIALFRQRTVLSGNWVLPFADAPHNLNSYIGLVSYLAREYDDAAGMDEQYESMFDDDTRYRFADFLRDFYWYNSARKERKQEETVCWETSQWYIHKSAPFTFACKGGDNDEPHNHNDLGGFVLFSGGQFVIDDLGWSEYYDGYFGSRRYEFLCASSRAHSVPIIDGQLQKAGKEYASKLLCHDGSGISYELSGAYGYTPLEKFVRRFDIKENGVTLSDTVTGNVQVTERFVTRIRPVIKENAVQIGAYQILCREAAKLSVTGETFEPRLNICKMDMQPVETAYLIDFRFPNGSGERQYSFEIKTAE